MRLPAVVYRLYERKLTRELVGAQIPHHVGVMLDGNRRWARKAGFENVSDGHRVGARHIADLLEWCTAAGIGTVTLWLLSTDNLRRSDDEVEALLAIIPDVADELAAPDKPWRLRIVGSMDVLPQPVATRLAAAEMRTADRTGLQINIAVGYGGRQEIVDAVRSLLAEGAERGDDLPELIESVTTEGIGRHLYTSGQPDPDLFIRTSGEQRLSGFLLWQSAHSEYWFCEAYWPDFRRVDFLRALRDYAARHRRFGE
ncbi:isoprenyl transferase [Nakamurella lactea]|uniref:isoprenyl transferase n=1 Tax=Nakamurella lactea TaxID=459515 RepID=UPI0003FB1D82|nr:isoprenyl transferase [Nakamurella lactea]